MTYKLAERGLEQCNLNFYDASSLAIKYCFNITYSVSFAPLTTTPSIEMLKCRPDKINTELMVEVT